MKGRTSKKTKKLFYAGIPILGVLMFFLILNLLIFNPAYAADDPVGNAVGNAVGSTVGVVAGQTTGNMVKDLINFGAKGLLNIGAIALSPFIMVGAWVTKTAFWLTGLLLAISSSILDYSIKYGIVNFADFFTNSNSIVNIGWTIFRDLANMLFLFIILWIGISTILGVGQGNPTSNIVKIIVAALLINFSMFFAKFIIDIANVIALHFYDLTLPVKGGVRSSLAGLFMSGTDIQTLYGQISFEEGASEMIYTKIILFSVVGIVMTLIATWIFLTAAFLMIVRTIYLVVLIMLSPVAFISWIVPSLKNYSSKWWDALFKHAFFAPVFMVMIYVIGRALTAGQILQKRTNASTLKTTLETVVDKPSQLAVNPNYFEIFFYFFLIFGLLIAAMMVATKLGGMGSGAMVKWGKKLGLNLAGGVVGGVVGGTASRIANSSVGEKLKSKGALGRLALRPLNKLQDKKFFGAKSYKETREQGTMFRVGTKERLQDLRNIQNDPVKMAKYFSGLKEKEQEALYTDELSARARASLHMEAEKAGNEKLRTQLKNHKAKLSKEDEDKLDDVLKKIRTTKEIGERVEDVENIANLISSDDKLTKAMFDPAKQNETIDENLLSKVEFKGTDKDRIDKFKESLSGKKISEVVKILKEKMRLNAEKSEKLGKVFEKIPELVKFATIDNLRGLARDGADITSDKLIEIGKIITDDSNPYAEQKQHQAFLENSMIGFAFGYDKSKTTQINKAKKGGKNPEPEIYTGSDVVSNKRWKKTY